MKAPLESVEATPNLFLTSELLRIHQNPKTLKELNGIFKNARSSFESLYHFSSIRLLWSTAAVEDKRKFGCVRIYSDLFGCIQTNSDEFGKVAIQLKAPDQWMVDQWKAQLITAHHTN